MIQPDAMCKRLAFVVLAAMPVLPLPASAALECSIVATGAGTAEVFAGDASVKLPAVLPDCEGARIKQGEVAVCVQDERNRLRCRTLAGAAVIGQATVGASSAEERPWLKALGRMFAGDIGSQSALSRGTGRTELDLPSGEVALLQSVLEIDLRAVKVVRFRDIANDRVVLEAQGGGIRKVDLTTFEPGKSYSWTVDSDDPVLATRFTVQDQKSIGMARAEQARIAADPQLDPTARVLTLATWLFEQGLAYDARTALAAGHLAIR